MSLCLQVRGSLCCCWRSLLPLCWVTLATVARVRPARWRFRRRNTMRSSGETCRRSTWANRRPCWRSRACEWTGLWRLREFEWWHQHWEMKGCVCYRLKRIDDLLTRACVYAESVYKVLHWESHAVSSMWVSHKWHCMDLPLWTFTMVIRVSVQNTIVIYYSVLEPWINSLW